MIAPNATHITYNTIIISGTWISANATFITNYKSRAECKTRPYKFGCDRKFLLSAKRCLVRALIQIQRLRNMALLSILLLAYLHDVMPPAMCFVLQLLTVSTPVIPDKKLINVWFPCDFIIFINCHLVINIYIFFTFSLKLSASAFPIACVIVNSSACVK